MLKEIEESIKDSSTELNEYIAEGDIKVFEGPQRSGKTLAGCIFSLQSFHKKRQVYSTIPFKFPHLPLNFNELKLENKTNPLRNAHIFIDELNFYLDSRASTSKINREFCAFLLQVKKQGCYLTGTSHELSYLDLRFRQNYDYRIFTKVYPSFPKTPETLTMKITNGPTVSNLNKTITMKVKQFLGLYDTFTIYNPFAQKGESVTRTNPKLDKITPFKV